MGKFCSKMKSLCLGDKSDEDYIYVPYYDDGQATLEGQPQQMGAGGQVPVTALQQNPQPAMANNVATLPAPHIQMVAGQQHMGFGAQPAAPVPQGVPVRPVKPVPIMGVPIPRPMQGHALQPSTTGGAAGAGGSPPPQGVPLPYRPSESAYSSSYPTSYQPACMEWIRNSGGCFNQGSSYSSDY